MKFSVLLLSLSLFKNPDGNALTAGNVAFWVQAFVIFRRSNPSVTCSINRLPLPNFLSIIQLTCVSNGHTMKPGGGTKVTGAKTVACEDKVRPSLHVLQPTATDKENLVGGGRMLRSALATKEGLKPEITEKPKHDTTKRKKVTLKDKAVQTARGDKILIEVEDLTSEAGPSENYWEVLAERRRIALEDALEENKELSDRAEKLEEENRVYKEMLDESRALIEVLQDMLGEDGNGINNSLDDSAL